MSRTSPVLVPAALAALAAASLAACGTADPPIPQAPSTSATTQARFPLTVSRVGGIAGFTDNLSIQDDGGVIATTKQGQVTCTIDRATLAVLNDAAAQVRDTDQPTAPPANQSDSMAVLIGAGTGLLPIDDARVAKAEPVVTQLLADVTGPAARRKLCT